MKATKEYIGSQEFHEKLKKQDQEAFHLLYEYFQLPVYRVVFSMLGDRERTADILQDTFIQAIKKIHQLQDVKKLKYWIFRIAINLTINQMNREKKWYLPGDEMVRITDRTEVENYQIHLALDSETTRERVLELVFRLPIKQRIVFNLKYVEGFKEAEIAEMVDIPIGTVKSRLNIARNQIKTWLQAAPIESKKESNEP